MGMLDGFGMDTITLAGPLEAKLAAMANAGFSQVMLSARDIVGHPGGVPAAVEAVRASGLRPTGFQVLRDFEGLSGHLHGYKVDIAKSMLEMCAALGSEVLLACSSTSRHATQDLDAIARDLRKLAMLAVPLGIKVAYEALSWGRTVNEFTTAWDLVCMADCPNLGLGLDSFHVFAAKTPLDGIDTLDPARIFLVQLSDFMCSMTTTSSCPWIPWHSGHGAAPCGCARMCCTGPCRCLSGRMTGRGDRFTIAYTTQPNPTRIIRTCNKDRSAPLMSAPLVWAA